MRGRSIVILENMDRIDRLLVECLRVELPITKETNLDSVASLCQTFIEWPGIVERAGFQGVICWAHEVLSRLDESLVPSETVADLRLARLVNAS